MPSSGRASFSIVNLARNRTAIAGYKSRYDEHSNHIPATGLYTYPDLVATCKDPKFIDAELDTLLNPILLVEILSQSTQNYDRGGKFADYRSIRSLTEYLTVAQDEIHIEHWKLLEGHWTLTEYRDPAATIALKSVAVQVQIRNVYARCDFAPTT